MPTYTVQSPDGVSVDIQGDSLPDEPTLDQIFSKAKAVKQSGANTSIVNSVSHNRPEDAMRSAVVSGTPTSPNEIGPPTPIMPFRIPRPSEQFSKDYPRTSGIVGGVESTAESALSPAGLAIGAGSMLAPYIGIPARVMAAAGGAAMVPPMLRSINNAIQTPDTKTRWQSGTEAAGMGLMAFTGLNEGLNPPRAGLPASAIEGAKSIIPDSVDPMITERYTKAVRPTVVGKATATQMDTANSRAVEAVKSIVANKGDLNILDQYGEPTGKLPETLHQFSQAIEQTKAKIFQQYDALQSQAGEAGAKVDLTPISEELTKVAENPVVKDIHPAVADYADGMAKSLSERSVYTPSQAQEAIAHLNAKLEAFYKNPTYENASAASVDAMMANKLRSGLDETIDSATGEAYQPLKNQYGALSSIEKDVAHRAIVDARRNVKGLVDFTDIFSASDLVKGLATQNPAMLASAAAKKGFAEWIKWKNNPNVTVRKMFQGVDNATQIQTP